MSLCKLSALSSDVVTRVPFNGISEVGIKSWWSQWLFIKLGLRADIKLPGKLLPSLIRNVTTISRVSCYLSYNPFRLNRARNSLVVSARRRETFCNGNRSKTRVLSLPP